MANLELLRDVDVAAALKVSRRQVHKLRAAGVLPEPVRLGRSTRWRASDLAAALDRASGQSEGGKP